MPVPCARCQMPLNQREYLWSGTAVCTVCGSGNSVRVFPAMLAAAAPAVPQAALEGEASCFDHPNKRAEAACSQCGRYLCRLCAVEFGAEIWCPACVTARSGAAQAANPERSRTLFDSITLTLPLASLIVWPTTILAAPAALALGIARWSRPLSLVRRNRWRLVLGMTLAGAELIGWVWLIVYLVTRPAVGRF